MRVLMYHAEQCDPRKCTGAKLLRQGLCEEVRKVDRLKHTVFLDPYESAPLSPMDREDALKLGIGLIDASWSRALDQHDRFRARFRRRLPHLVPVNPMNYGKLSMLTSAEAIAGALFILGDTDTARKVLSAIQWGPHFEELNAPLLECYAKAKCSDDILRLEKELFPL
jgi:pre-rRNA-processing protein TSR3